jgi:hypothetical protein
LVKERLEASRIAGLGHVSCHIGGDRSNIHWAGLAGQKDNKTQSDYAT